MRPSVYAYDEPNHHGRKAGAYCETYMDVPDVFVPCLQDQLDARHTHLGVVDIEYLVDVFLCLLRSTDMKQALVLSARK